MMLGDAMLPGWVVIPLALLTMLGVAGHVLSVHASDMPLQRRRLRIAAGMLMLVLTGLLAYALGVAEVVVDPRTQPGAARQFVIIWLAIVGLLAIVVMLAIVDAWETTRSGWVEHRRLRAKMRSESRSGSDGGAGGGGRGGGGGSSRG
ncbi:MAG: hypothetical protein K2W85_13030 [Phycisphaerales bacterium]|nr:hypothetical protein [Phycisphaerales bacterium]